VCVCVCVCECVCERERKRERQREILKFVKVKICWLNVQVNMVEYENCFPLCRFEQISLVLRLSLTGLAFFRSSTRKVFN
jgi:hypothetical protein